MIHEHGHDSHPFAPVLGVNTVVVSTFASRALRAVVAISRRSWLSNSAGKLGSPQGCGIATPLTMRLAPTCCATGYMALITATGRPVSYTHLRAHETPEHLVCRL